nr:venom polypeptide precursor [Doratifera vulnerans]
MASSVLYFVIIIISLTYVNTDNAVKFYQQKDYHEAQDLTDQNIRDIAALTDTKNFKTILDNILVPRVVGTEGHEKVANYIVSQMQGRGWDVSQDVFEDRTPTHGKLTFKNIIAKLNPHADRYLVLACHYDSKYTREHVFVGATDSAVPCAMMINLANVLASSLEPLKHADLSLMFIFFDGEEAFRQWGPTDSIYGARHLAKKWERSPYRDGANELQRMFKPRVILLITIIAAFSGFKKAFKGLFEKAVSKYLH